MFGPTLCDSGRLHECLLANSGRGRNRDDFGLAERDSPGLIENSDIDGCEGLKIARAFDDGAGAGRLANGAKDRKRRSCRNSARTGHDNDRNSRDDIPCEQIRKDCRSDRKIH
jgi:hypothetical protein